MCVCVYCCSVAGCVSPSVFRPQYRSVCVCVCVYDSCMCVCVCVSFFNAALACAGAVCCSLFSLLRYVCPEGTYNTVLLSAIRTRNEEHQAVKTDATS